MPTQESGQKYYFNFVVLPLAVKLSVVGVINYK